MLGSFFDVLGGSFAFASAVSLLTHSPFGFARVANIKNFCLS